MSDRSVAPALRQVSLLRAVRSLRRPPAPLGALGPEMDHGARIAARVEVARARHLALLALRGRCF